MLYSTYMDLVLVELSELAHAQLSRELCGHGEQRLRLLLLLASVNCQEIRLRLLNSRNRCKYEQ